MRRLITLLLALAPFIAFSQGALKTEIDWIPLEKAKKYAKNRIVKIRKGFKMKFNRINEEIFQEMY